MTRCRSGRWRPPGYPTRELADAFGISKGTIDFAITLLRDAAPDGAIERVGGSSPSSPTTARQGDRMNA
jgi:hypothetical protein